MTCKLEAPLDFILANATKGGRAMLFILLTGILFGGAAADALGQIDASETLRIRGEVAELDKKINLAKKKVAEASKALKTKKKTIARQHKRAFTAKNQEKAGTALAALLKGHCGLETPDKTPEQILEAFGIDYRKAFKLDSAFTLTSRRHIIEGIGALMEEKVDPSVVRCARIINDAFDAAFGKDFDAAWVILKKENKQAKKLVKAQAKYDQLVREKRDAIASLTSGVRGNIPRNMAVIPGAVDAILGLTKKDIEELSAAENEKAERNYMLAFGSNTENKTLPTFLIDRYEVTHRAYWYFCQQTERAPEDWPQQYSTNRKTLKKEFSTIWPNGEVPFGWDNRPITWLRYDDMVDYCRWTNTHIPTEDEWEVAARSSESGYDGRFWPFTNEKYEKHLVNDALAHDLAIRLKIKVPKGLDFASFIDVSALPDGASPLGILHMVGNAAEMTSSPFVARSSFKTIKFGPKKKVTSAVFNSDKHVIRGGHCDSRSLLASSVMRFQADPLRRSKMIGFRRARSATPGAEVLANLRAGGQLDARLQDYKLMKSGMQEELPRPQIDTRADRFTALEKFDWNEEYKVPGAAHSIFIANRVMNDLSNEKSMMTKSEGEDEVADSILLGILHSDVPILEPKLDPGTWFVSYKKGWKYKDEQTKKKVTVPNRYIFRNKRSGIAPVYVRAKSQTTVSRTGGTTKFEISRAPVQKPGGKMIAARDKFDKLSCIWAHKIKGSRKNALVTELVLKLAPGSLDGYK